MRPATCYRQFAVRPRRINSHDGVGDAGNALIEFVFVAVLILIPLVYFVVAVASVQRSGVAVTHAAREAGRAFATADSTGQGVERAEVAVRLALADQGLSDDANVRYVAADGTCESDTITPSLNPGAQFAVCVIRRLPSRRSFADIGPGDHDSWSLCAPHRRLSGRGAMNAGDRLADDRGSTIPLILGCFVVAFLIVAGSVAAGDVFCSSGICRVSATARQRRRPRRVTSPPLEGPATWADPRCVWRMCRKPSTSTCLGTHLVRRCISRRG